MRQLFITSQVLMSYVALCPAPRIIKLQNIKPLSCSLECAPQQQGIQNLIVQSFLFVCSPFLHMGQESLGAGT